MKKLEIVCVVGPVGSGKTTLINDRYDSECHVVVHFGKIITGMVGKNVIRNSSKPNAPKVADALVLSLCRQALHLGASLRRSVAFDGFPRTVYQWRTLLRVIKFGSYERLDPQIIVTSLRVSEATQLSWIKGRSGGVVSLFDRARITESRLDFKVLMIEIRRNDKVLVNWINQDETIGETTSEDQPEPNPANVSKTG